MRWLKSGQNDVRSKPLALTQFAMEVLFPAVMPGAPALVLLDAVENLSLPLTGSSTNVYAGNPLFNVATYDVDIYAGAAYTVSSQNNVENPPIVRPFPADPTNPSAVSRFALGASAWLSAFPGIAPRTLSIQPHGMTSFGSGVSAQVALGNSSAYQTVPAVQQADGTWLAQLSLAQDTTTSVRLAPASGSEPKPYEWIDVGRYFKPRAGAAASGDQNWSHRYG
jgi:hypothetical protein